MTCHLQTHAGIRANHVQCDETHPECKSCLRFKVRCSFKDLTSDTNTSGSQSASAPDLPTSASDQELDHAIDLELMANVFLGPLHTIFSCREDDNHDFIKQHTALLFSKRYLLHQVLALSALEACSHDRSRPEIYLRASYHQKEALALAQTHIGSADEEHSLATFFFASYAAVCAAAEMLFSQNHQDDNPIDITVHAWRLGRGIVIVSTSNWPHIRASWVWPIVQKQIEASAGLEPRPKEIPAYQAVRSLAFGVQPAEDRTVCLNAVEHTFGAISLLRQRSNQQLATKLVTSWPIEINAKFDDLVSKRHPAALVIMAYYACMLNLASDLWWVGDWPKTLIRQIVQALGEEWREFLEWPLEILSEMHTNNTPSGYHAGEAIQPVPND